MHGRHDGMGCGMPEDQRVAVRRRGLDIFGADQARGTGAVFYYHRLLPHDGQPLRQHAGQEVGAAGGRTRHDQLDGPVREGARNRRAGGCHHHERA